MLLNDKVAIVYGGGGAIGGATARAFAREGARVFLAGRTQARLDAVANDIRSAGAKADTAVIDVLDEDQVERHADAVVADAGRIDIAMNAVGFFHVQNVLFGKLSLADFELPIHTFMRSHFITAKAVTRHMAKQRSGVFLTLSTPGSKPNGTGYIGYGTTCAAIESFTGHLAAELGGDGIRTICLRPDAMPEAVELSYAKKVFAPAAEAAGMSIDAMLQEHAKSAKLGRLPKLAEVADYAAFVASDRAGAMTGAIANLTCGSMLD